MFQMISSMRWEGTSDSFNYAFQAVMQCKSNVKILATVGDRVLGGLGNVILAPISRNIKVEYLQSTSDIEDTNPVVLEILQSFKNGYLAISGPNTETSLVIVDNEMVFFTQHNPDGSIINEGAGNDKEGVDHVLQQFRKAWSGAAMVLGFSADTKIFTAPPPIITINQTKEWDRILKELHKNPADMHKLSPRRFEEMVAELLVKEGFTVEITQETRDGGKDILAFKKEFFGETLFYVECKKWSADNPVGVKVIREVFGQITSDKVNGGIIATTSYFSPDAIQWQQQHSRLLQLQDYYSLTNWLNRHYGSSNL